MKIFIEKGEKYPPYRMSDVGHLGFLDADVPLKTKDNWKAIFTLYHRMQDELAILHTQSLDRKDAERTKHP